ncbi:MAG: helicase-associated domain-containing protein, partial [Sphaerochaetaceae bacterium]
MMQDSPLIVQSDKTLLLDVHHQQSEACRNDLVRFCELVKSPEHMHTYALSAISLWNAAGCGVDASFILSRLDHWSKFPVPESVRFYIEDMAARWGKVILSSSQDPRYVELWVESNRIRTELLNRPAIAKLLIVKDATHFLLETYNRGEIKLQLIKIGYPVDDRIPLHHGPALPFILRETT